MQFAFDDTFLDENGLGQMPAHEKAAFLEHIRSEFELRVGSSLSVGLSDDLLEEFEAIFDRRERVVMQWIESNSPDYREDQLFIDLEAGAPSGASSIDILSEYASAKWLEINCPDYRQKIAAEMELLREEIAVNAALILGTP
jgi:hypothetical protein